MLSATVQSRMVDASTDLASASLSSPRSYESSTSRFRLSGGRFARESEFQNVLCRVLIAVLCLAALNAGEFTNVQRHLLVNVSAIRTSLATRKKPIRNANLSAVPSSLVFQHGPEHAETGATDMFGKPWIADHSTHVQVFDRQHVKPANKVGSQLIQAVLATVADMSLMLGHAELLPSPTVASLDTAGKHSLQASQLSGVSHRVPWVGNPLSVGECCQPKDSKIDPDLLPRLGECGLRWLIQTKTHEISTGTVLGYRNRARRTREFATPLDAEATYLGYAKVLVGGVPSESANAI